MADDVKPEVIKKTQDSLGKYFKKPPLTEKLLRKPPFRFLHDIVSAVINETGFLSGLFTEDELNSETIKNKEAKLAYLTKLIDVVKLATGASLTVRASKIISGQEPTKTNELLQAIGRALDKKLSSAEAIEQYKKGLEKGKSSSKGKSSATKDERRGKEASQKRVAASKEKSREEKKKVSNESNAVIVEEPRRNEKQDVQKNIEPTEIPPVEQPQEKVPPSAHKRRSSSAKPKQSAPLPESNDGKPNSATSDKKTDESKRQKESENKLKRNGESNESQTQRVLETPKDRDQEDAKRSETKSATSKAKDSKANEISEKAEEKESEIKLGDVPLQNLENLDQSPAIPETQHFPSESNKDARIPYSNFRPRTSLRPPSARPISARPAAPRIRGKTELIVNEEMLTPMGNISVIVENSDLKEDDDDAEDMVVMESKGGADSLENSGNYKVDDQLTQEHGHLVAQILETQKELVNNDNVDVIPKKTNISWDTSSKRDVVAKEIDKLRNTIQTLTRATNPLGKLLDYFQEDVEIMQKELLEWRCQYQQVNEQLKIEKTKTQELIEPMKETLKEIDHNMKAQLDKICQAKSQIMKNDQRIQTLLNGRA